MRTPAVLALSIAALFANQGVFAGESKVTSSLANLQFSVVDLTPGDGAAASFSLGSTTVDTGVGYETGGHDINNSGPGLTSWAYADFNDQARARTTDGTPTGSILTAAGDAIYRTHYAFTDSFTRIDGTYTLAAHAELTLDATAAANVSDRSNTSQSQGFVLLTDLRRQGDIATAYFRAGDASPQQISCVFANDSDAAVTGYFSYGTRAYAIAVPEPADAALMLFGLGALGLARRKRARQA